MVIMLLVHVHVAGVPCAHYDWEGGGLFVQHFSYWLLSSSHYSGHCLWL